MNKNGIALVVALMAITLIGAISTIMFSRTVSEIKHSATNASIVQTLMLARGAANAGGEMLTGPIKEKLLSIVVDNFESAGPWAFGSPSANPNQPDPASVIAAFSGSGKFLDSMQDNVNAELCTLNLPSENGATITLRVFFKNEAITVCEQTIPYPSQIPLPKPRFVKGGPRGIAGPTGQVYAVPFVMVAEAIMGQYRRNIVVQGEFEFDAEVSSFARFALFTNKHESPDATSIWFTERTRFEGPVHTNQNFRFYRNPYFGDHVSSAGCKNPGPDGCLGTYERGGIFYGVNNNKVIKNPGSKPSYTNSYGTHAPQFIKKTVDWNASFIALPKEAIDMEARARDRGLVLDGHLSNLQMFAGDANGNPLTPAAGNTWQPNPAPFQYIHACFTPTKGVPNVCALPCADASVCALYRYGPDGALFRQNGAAWDAVNNSPAPPGVPEPITNFNGMVYVNGEIQQFGGPPRATISDPNTAPPALAAFATLTVANAGTGNHVGITGDLKYESLPCPEAFSGATNYTCTNMTAKNVLGVYSQDSDILLGDGTNSSLQDLTVHGVLMTSGGTVAAKNYQTISPRGSVKLLGGLIENTYGGFGTFNSGSGTYTSGYGRAFTYDKRMAGGVSPPYFPGTDIGNNQVGVRSFGQREQVY